MPSQGGPQGEKLLHQAFKNRNIRSTSCERCVPVLDGYGDLPLPDLQVLPECNRTVDFVFPHMYNPSIDSGAHTSSFRTMSSLQIPIGKATFDKNGDISQHSSQKGISLPSVPASHFH